MVHQYIRLLYSVRLGQAEHLFGDETYNKLRVYGCQARDLGLTQIPRLVILLSVAHASMSRDSVFASVVVGFRGKVLRVVGFGGAWKMLVM